MSNLKRLNTEKTMTYGIGNPDCGLGQVQTCGWVISVNGIPASLLLIIGSPMHV